MRHVVQIGRRQRDGREGVAPARFDADPDVKAQLVVDRGDLGFARRDRDLGIRDRREDLPVDPLDHGLVAVLMPEDLDELLGARIV